ncbi:MAG TPA: hypothetical protein VL326_07535 [Kofleriaceae bacterium]|nr:hypothetical protein [Kofleriaceae bacterium]
MGRFSSILVLLLGAAACGDNLGPDDTSISGGTDQVDPSGNQTATPRFVPSVCGVQTYTTNLSGDAMQLSVAARPQGAVLLTTSTTGSLMSGFVLDDRMQMQAATKLAIDGSFTSVVASYRNERLVSTAVQDGAVFMHLLDPDLGNPQYTAKLPGRLVSEPAFYNVQGDMVMPIAGDDGLWMGRFQDSFEPIDGKLMIPTKPARSMAAAQIGVATFVAWSTDSECYMYETSTYGAGVDTRLPVACNDPKLAVNQKTGDGVMAFNTSEGVRLMAFSNTSFGGDSALLRDSTSDPRVMFDGTNFWVSYLDTRGDILVGFLDANHNPITMSLAGPKPSSQAYDLVMIQGAPWVVSLDNGTASAYRLCVDTLE